MPMGRILFVFGNVESWATAHQFMGDTAGCLGRDQLHIVQTLLLKTLILTCMPLAKPARQLSHAMQIFLCL